jgi:RNA polymerase sigma-70 factor (ECF subfamily)
MGVTLAWEAALTPATYGSTRADKVAGTSWDRVELVGVATEVIDRTEMSDTDLMVAVAGGDALALETLYDRHSRGCFGLSMKIVRDPLVAEEVVQDVFMKLWSAPHTFTPERGKFSGWLLTLVHNRSVDRLRRARTQAIQQVVPLDATGEGVTNLIETLPDPSHAPDEQAWRGEQGEIVRRAVNMLPDAQRQALALAYFEGLTQREIAERLAQPIGTIKTRTRAALAQLRKLLAGYDLLGES